MRGRRGLGHGTQLRRLWTAGSGIVHNFNYVHVYVQVRVHVGVRVRVNGHVHVHTYLDTYAAVRLNKKLAKQFLQRHGLPDYANSSKQRRFNDCKDAETGFLLLL